eukprot:jgi/Orpsp1_1/1183184/evm.model.c7180000084208.1
MVNEVRAKTILEYSRSGNYDDDLFDKEVLYEYRLENHNYNENCQELININKSDDISCIFFTSGTTGKPKGILISHDNLINYGYSNSAVESLKDQINNTIPATRIRYYMNNEKFRESLATLKVLLFGGEGSTFEFLQYLIRFTEASVYLCYGMTESTSEATLGVITREEIIKGEILTIGEPIYNDKIYILDHQLKPVPVGVEGDIYISGLSICQGYLNQEELTNKVLMDCPYSYYTKKNSSMVKQKMYKTGDIGKWTNDGRIIHLGRADFQIKIRGQRVEIGEIEHAIKEIDGIDYTVVIDRMKKENKEKYLIGYYISKGRITESFIKNHLKSKLPTYMIPTYLIEIDKIPMTAHGKLDLKALPEPNLNEILLSHYETPETDTEKKLCAIY